MKTAQAFRPHVLDMFEPQDHPDDIPYPGAPPTPPYDSAGWTLALQMGVKFDRILDGFDGPFERVDRVLHRPPGRVRDRRSCRLFRQPSSERRLHAPSDRLLAAGEDVYWLRDRVTRRRPRVTRARCTCRRGRRRARFSRRRPPISV